MWLPGEHSIHKSVALLTSFIHLDKLVVLSVPQSAGVEQRHMGCRKAMWGSWSKSLSRVSGVLLSN